MKFNPHEYQRRAIEAMVSHACYGLFLDPGLGKTVISLAAFHLLKKQRMVRRMLVVCPLRPMFLTWPAEGKKWDFAKDLKIGVLHGPTKGTVLYDEDVDIHVINPEGLPWLFDRVSDPSELWDILLVDESTKFKHTDTQRFRLIRPHLEKFSRRYILTGSPAPNGLLDLFGQVYILDLGNSLGRYITHYRAQYFQQGYNGFDYVPYPWAEKKIYEKLGPMVLRMSATDYLQLPELIGACGTGEPLVRQVELPETARKTYDKMEQFMITELEDENITAANAAAVMNKCRQIANGGLYNSDHAFYHVHDAKTDAVVELVEELQGTPALVAYEYQHDLDRLLQKFPHAPHIGGGVSQARFREIEAAWNRGEIPVLLAQPQSVAHGLNLQNTHAAIIWHSITVDLEVYEQFIRRVWRQGQEERVFVHHVIAKGTVDEVILKLLQKKDRTQRALLDALKEEYL